jgi:hypothetical protein
MFVGPMLKTGCYFALRCAVGPGTRYHELQLLLETNGLSNKEIVP